MRKTGYNVGFQCWLQSMIGLCLLHESVYCEPEELLGKKRSLNMPSNSIEVHSSDGQSSDLQPAFDGHTTSYSS